jgi:hypothetical protein
MMTMANSLRTGPAACSSRPTVPPTTHHNAACRKPSKRMKHVLERHNSPFPNYAIDPLVHIPCLLFVSLHFLRSVDFAMTLSVESIHLLIPLHVRIAHLTYIYTSLPLVRIHIFVENVNITYRINWSGLVQSDFFILPDLYFDLPYIFQRVCCHLP